MSDEQKTAYVLAMVACANAEIAAMTAENQIRVREGQALAYGEKAFLDVPNRYGIHHNAVLELFRS